MTIIEHSPGEEEILDFIDGQIRQFHEDGAEAGFIVVGPTAYRRLCKAISVEGQRGKGTFETYNFVPIVLDPFRSDGACVLPGASECNKGVDTYRT